MHFYVDKRKNLCYNKYRRKGKANAAEVNCWCGSMAEQLICNQQVVGSTPITSSIYGSVPERPKGADCKSVVSDFGGPNPPAPTKTSSQDEVSFCSKILAGGFGSSVQGVDLMFVRTVIENAAEIDEDSPLPPRPRRKTRFLFA